MSSSGREVCIYVTSDISFPGPVYDIRLLRHHQCRQSLINNETRKSFAYLSVTPLFTEFKKKKQENRAKFNLLLIFFSRAALFCCAAFIVRAKFEQMKKEGSRLIFAILSLSSTIRISTFLFSDELRKVSFFSLFTGFFPPEKFQKLYNSQQRA